MLVCIIFTGVPTREKDEGVGAHLFQIWLVLEIIMLAFFAITWLPRAPKPAFLILLMQVIATLLPMSIVFFLHV